MFDEQSRLDWINKLYEGNPKVAGIIYEGLTIDCCKKLNAKFIIRGIRYVSDFEYEKAIADMNRNLSPEIETVFFTCQPKFTSVASTLIRDVLQYGGDVSEFLPEIVNQSIK